MQWHVNHPGFVCRTCRYELENKDALKAHMEQHKIKSPFECVLCDKNFNGKKYLLRHMVRHVCYFDFLFALLAENMSIFLNVWLQGDPKHLCEQCGKKFTTRFQVVIHQAVHSEERTNKCPQCPKAFKTKRNLAQHIETHVNSRNFLFLFKTYF